MSIAVPRCTVCATTIYDGDDEVCRHGWRTCLACDARDACDECNTEWLADIDDGEGFDPTATTPTGQPLHIVRGESA